MCLLNDPNQTQLEDTATDLCCQDLDALQAQLEVKQQQMVSRLRRDVILFVIVKVLGDVSLYSGAHRYYRSRHG